MRGLTQNQLAQASGVSQQAVDKLEKSGGQRSANIIKLAMALGAEPRWIATGEGPMLTGPDEARGMSWRTLQVALEIYFRRTESRRQQLPPDRRAAEFINAYRDVVLLNKLDERSIEERLKWLPS